MKFKKDGKVFEDIGQALESAFHCNECCGWSVCKFGTEAMRSQSCSEFAARFPAEAARLMGYEVVEDVPDIYVGEKEASMDKRKPLKDWTLEEVQNICAATGSDCKGCPFVGPGICRVNSIPGIWDLSERPRFTEAEVADARAILRIEHSAWTTLVRKMDNALWLNDGEGGWHELRPGAFPSILPGQSVKLSDIVGGDTE